MDESTAAAQVAASLLDDTAADGQEVERLIAAVQEITEWIRHYEGIYQASPLRADYRSRLAEIIAAADLLAEAIARPRARRPTDLGEQVDQTVDQVLAQWVAQKGDLRKPLEAFRQGLGAAIRNSGGRGEYRVTDATGTPRGRMFCAVATVELWKIFVGRAPGRTNTRLQALCDAMWSIVCEPDPEGGRWERQLRHVLDGPLDEISTAGYQLTTARDHVRSILVSHGFLPVRDDLDINRPQET